MWRLGSLIFRNIIRNRRRTLLTMASTAVSLALLCLLLAIFQGFFYGEDISPTEARRMVCRHHVSLVQTLPASHQQRINSVPGVVGTCGWTWFQGVYKDPKNFFARFAVDPSVIFDFYPEWNISPEQLQAFKREKTACAVAESIAKKYGIHLGDRVTIVGDIYPVTLELTCVAIFKHPPQSEMLVFNRAYLTELLPKTSPMRDTVGTFLVMAQNAEDVPHISRAIDTMFEDSPYPTRTESEKEFGRSFLAFIGNIKLFLAAVVGAVTFTVLLVSANTVAMAVRERTRETAILRTLGFSPLEILQMVVGESVLVSVMGGLVGIGIGWVVCLGLYYVAASFGMQTLKWQAMLIVLGMSVLIGTLSSIVPAFVASRRNLVESLRFAG